METGMGVAAILLSFVGALGVTFGHHRSIWGVTAGAIAPEGMSVTALASTLLAAQIAAFCLIATRLWRGPGLWSALLVTTILAAECVMRVIDEAGPHVVFIYMAATIYAATSVRASWFLRGARLLKRKQA